MIGRGALGLGKAGDILYGSVVDTGFGTKVDCRNTWAYIANTGCWQLSPSAWDRLGASYDAQTYPNPPAPAPPAAPQTQDQMTQPGAWTPDQAIAATKQTQNQQYTDFFSQLAQTLPQDSTVDCTDPATLLTTWSCGVLPVLLAAGAVFLLMRR